MDDDEIGLTEEELEQLLADLESNDPNSLFYQCLKDAQEEALRQAGLSREEASVEAGAYLTAACEINAEIGPDELLSDPKHRERFEDTRAAYRAALLGERDYQKGLLTEGPGAAASVLTGETRPSSPSHHHPLGISTLTNLSFPRKRNPDSARPAHFLDRLT